MGPGQALESRYPGVTYEGKYRRHGGQGRLAWPERGEMREEEQVGSQVKETPGGVWGLEFFVCFFLSSFLIEVWLIYSASSVEQNDSVPSICSFSDFFSLQAIIRYWV